MKRFLSGINTVIFTFIFLITINPLAFAQELTALSVDELSSVAEIDYEAHVSEQGWQGSVSDGEVAGTTGQGLAIEAMAINLPDNELFNSSNVNYSVQCQNIGWVNQVSNGQVAGTIGQGLHAEAFSINLDGPAAQTYDVYYRVHSSYFGWLDWAKDGQVAGTTGINVPAEAIQIELVPKDTAAPGPVDRPAITPEYLDAVGNLEYTSHVSTVGWQDATFRNGDIAGTMGQGLPVEAFAINMNHLSGDSAIVYQAYVDGLGWMNPVSNGQVAGTVGEGKEVQAMTISLTGLDACCYDIWYQAYVENYGWLGFAKNGEISGTSGGGLRLEAFRILLQPKGAPAPGSTENAYLELHTLEINNWLWPLDGIYNISSNFGPRGGRMHEGTDILAPQGTPIRATRSGTVKVAGWYYGYGNCVVVENDYTGERVYYGHMIRVNTNVGAHVNQGDVIGFVGSTGNSTANHLHLGVLVNGSFVNALQYYGM